MDTPNSNIHWHIQSVQKTNRAVLKKQSPMCIWLTGLSGAGKSTIANNLELRLHEAGLHTYHLDGDNVRHGLNSDLGFTDEARVENVRRVAEVARLMVDAGLIVIVSMISPFAAQRTFARSLFADGEFCEVYVDSKIEDCISRDPKGLYAKALRGDLKNFTGLDSPYEIPESPEVHINTGTSTPFEAASLIFQRVCSINEAYLMQAAAR
jgi:bifunctional enzyme CysN/CysC